MLFARPGNKRLLISLLTAFLEPASPIVDVQVLNPEVTKETVEDKGTVLDILAKLEDGRQVNLEIQTTAQGSGTSCASTCRTALSSSIWSTARIAA